ncbi:uncharacterized protein LOC143024548 [Oratosquilla oratoria]|uniref:uncharacterized protein LOC143024548 n=1 Tax=Oratosquilla oratoria TaxID=337810 RepID=UPI003F76A709
MFEYKGHERFRPQLLSLSSPPHISIKNVKRIPREAVDSVLASNAEDQECHSKLSSVQFHPKDVESHLKSLDVDSTMGPDNLYSRLLKECALELAYLLSIIFNKSMASGQTVVTDHLLLTYDYITDRYDQGQVVDLILFDFAKAFDRVHHQTLIDKLVAIGILGNLLQWITSFLLGRSMKVTINGHIQCNYKIFADDLKLYQPSSSTSDCTQSLPGMQDNIDLLAATVASWGLRISAGKCVHLRIARQR